MTTRPPNAAPDAAARSDAPHRPANDAARQMARQMLDAARDAVLAVLDEGGWPQVSRIALQTDAAGTPLALLSGLALHSAALTRDPRAALLIDMAPGAAPARGTALARPRLSLQVRALRVDDAAETAMLHEDWRARDPKSAVYLGLPDFRFWRLQVQGGLLNAGFGSAFRLSEADLARP